MATAEDLLKKSEARKKKKFEATKRRAWDYINSEPSTDSNKNLEQKSEQIGNKYRNNLEHISEQNRNEYKNNLEHISEQNRNEYRNENINRNKYEISSETDHVFNQPLNIYTSDKKIEAYILNSLRKISGHQRKIMEQITAHIKSLSNIENIVNIPIATVSARLNVDRGTIRTSIKRLQKKEILLKSKGERGRHGSTQVIVPTFIIKECLNLFDCIPLSFEEIRYKNGNEYGNTNPIYSSSYINTTTSLPKEWRIIDYESLLTINFSETQLKQLIGKNTPEVVQESINHFAFGLENNPKIKQYSDPLNVLMGVLRKGQAWVEQNYRSPQEIAQHELIERKKAERERLKQLEEEAYQLAFEEWQGSLSTEQLESIAPPKQGRAADFIPQAVKLNLYFKENVWPGKRLEYLIL